MDSGPCGEKKWRVVTGREVGGMRWFSFKFSGSREAAKTQRLGGRMVDEEAGVQRQFDVVIERDSEGYYVASVHQMAGCHTQARSLDEVMERIREAIALCFEVQGEPPEQLEFVGVQRVTAAA